MPSPIDIQKALSGMDYPATKDQIVQHAEQNGADKEILDALRKIDDREYEGPSGVSSAVFG
jgi:trehalose-6-phosphatase